MKENHQSSSKRKENMHDEDDVSWMSTLLKIENCIFPFLNVMKVIFTLLGLIFGFPWLYLSAFIVERKPVIDYSWSEVYWRCFGGIGFLVNGIALYTVTSVFQLGQNEIWNKGNSLMGVFLGYGIGMSLLIICQAFWGRWYEEKDGPGGGQKAVQRFYLFLFMLIGLDTENVQPMSTSWTWAFSLLSLFLGSVFHSLIVVLSGLYEDGVTTQCSDEIQSCDVNSDATGSICGDNKVMATFGNSCKCCSLMVNDTNYIDVISEIGGLIVFYYGTLKVLATLFVWAEKGADNTEKVEEEDNANDSKDKTKQPDIEMNLPDIEQDVKNVEKSAVKELKEEIDKAAGRIKSSMKEKALEIEKMVLEQHGHKVKLDKGQFEFLNKIDFKAAAEKKEAEEKKKSKVEGKKTVKKEKVGDKKETKEKKEKSVKEEKGSKEDDETKDDGTEKGDKDTKEEGTEEDDKDTKEEEEGAEDEKEETKEEEKKEEEEEKDEKEEEEDSKEEETEKQDGEDTNEEETEEEEKEEKSYDEKEKKEDIEAEQS